MQNISNLTSGILLFQEEITTPLQIRKINLIPLLVKNYPRELLNRFSYLICNITLNRMVVERDCSFNLETRKQNALLNSQSVALKNKQRLSEYERKLGSLQKYNFKDYCQW